MAQSGTLPLVALRNWPGIALMWIALPAPLWIIPAPMWRYGSVMQAILSSLLFVWAGLLLGVAFVATPAKFLAPSVPLAHLLDVGRWTFHVLAWIEWPVALIALVILLVARERIEPRQGMILACLAGIAAVLALETFWLRPILDERLLAIIAGQSIPDSRLHDVYIGLDVLKLMLILGAAVLSTATRSDRTS